MSRHMSRARRGGDGGTHWISYSDMMCSLLLMFILAITLCIYPVSYTHLTLPTT